MSRRAGARIPRARRATIEAVSENRCGYCLTAEKYCGARLETEHLKPRARHGDSSEANLWLCLSIVQWSQGRTDTRDRSGDR